MQEEGLVAATVERGAYRVSGDLLRGHEDAGEAVHNVQVGEGVALDVAVFERDGAERGEPADAAGADAEFVAEAEGCCSPARSSAPDNRPRHRRTRFVLVSARTSSRAASAGTASTTIPSSMRMRLGADKAIEVAAGSSELRGFCERHLLALEKTFEDGGAPRALRRLRHADEAPRFVRGNGERRELLGLRRDAWAGKDVFAGDEATSIESSDGTVDGRKRARSRRASSAIGARSRICAHCFAETGREFERVDIGGLDEGVDDGLRLALEAGRKEEGDGVEDRARCIRARSRKRRRCGRCR